LTQLSEEQKLSKLMRDNELCGAAVLAFKMNKLRDFFFAMNRIVNGKLMPPRAHIPGAVILSVKSREQAIE
jgi:hypothetical protein